MNRDQAQFSVMLSKDEVQTIINSLFESRIIRAPELREDTLPLIDRLQTRLSMREKEMQDLEELMAQPDYDVGI
jgi:hypothetical protein